MLECVPIACSICISRHKVIASDNTSCFRVIKQHELFEFVTASWTQPRHAEEEFEVQEILNHSPAYKTRSDTNTRFLVQWKGYGPAYNSWEPASALTKNAPDSLSDSWDEVKFQFQ